MSKGLTTAMLIRAKGSKELVEGFAMEFPKGIQFASRDHAISLCRKYADQIDFQWMGKHMLFGEHRNLFQTQMERNIEIHKMSLATTSKDFIDTKRPADQALEKAISHAVKHLKLTGQKTPLEQALNRYVIDTEKDRKKMKMRVQEFKMILAKKAAESFGILFFDQPKITRI